MLPIRQQYKKPHPLSQLLQALRCSPRALKTTPFLEALFEHLPMAAAIVDEHDRIVSINPAFTALFGFSAEEALGKPIGELIVPEELRAEGKHFTEVALHGEPISTETVRKHREGERIPVWIRAVPIRLSGQHLGVLALYHDIRPLHQHRQRLVQLVEELQQLNTAKDRLLAIIAHDLRSPLATAQGLLGLILAEAHSPEALTEHVTKLQRILTEQLELVNELLEFARVETGHITLELTEVDLCEILANVVDTLTLSAYNKQIRLLCTFPEEGLYLQGDAAKLQRIFWNLLSNAIKFTPEGGTVEVEARLEPNSTLPIVVRISDTGIGISSEQLHYLFKPFSASRPGTHGERGTGLGLFIVKRFVDLHGGEITVRSTPGQGTTVLLSFPGTPPQQ